MRCTHCESFIVDFKIAISKTELNQTYDLLRDASISIDSTNRYKNIDGNQSEPYFDGIHTKHYANGDVYTGEFLYGLRTGKGKLVQKDGTVYEGEWF